MNKLPMKNPVSLIPVVVGCINRLVDAYETSKRIELEREQLECQHDLDVRKLALMEREISRRHKLALKALALRDRELTAYLGMMERDFGVYEAKMKGLVEQSKMAMDRICHGDEKDRAFYLPLWLKINEVSGREMALKCEQLSRSMLEYNHQVANLLGCEKPMASLRQIALEEEVA